jgi:hypothetical protein
VLEELKRIKRRLAGDGRDDPFEASYGYLGSLHGGSTAAPAAPAEWSATQGQSEAVQASSGGAKAASTPPGALGSLERSVASADRSTYVEGSTFMQSLRQQQQEGRALGGFEEESEELEESEEEEEELAAAGRGGAMMLYSEPQHLV